MRRNVAVLCVLLVVALSVCLPLSVQGGSPAVGPGLDAGEVELVGQLGGNTYAVAVQSNSAYAGIGPRFVVVDVSGPVPPLALGQSRLTPDVDSGPAVSGTLSRTAQIQVLGPTTIRVSVASDGTQGNAASVRASVSADGRYVAFDSLASNLVPGDTNDCPDVFVHDRQTGLTSRVSVASDGTQGNNYSGGVGHEPPSLSADGRYVAFASAASNLVPGDTNDCPDVFVHDRQTGQTIRVSVASDNAQAHGSSELSVLSADGRYVAFHSLANNLVPGDTNGHEDVFVHDRETHLTTRISVSPDGIEGNDASFSSSISADGRYVAFGSFASNLVAGDTNGFYDIFVHDRQTGQTIRVSVASDGTQGNNDARAYGWYQWPSLSADGRYVAFASAASNLVPGDTNGHEDVFVHDRETHLTTRISVASNGAQGNDTSLRPSLSADGRYVAFTSSARNLVLGDTNGCEDIFVHDRQTGQTIRVSVAADGSEGGTSWDHFLSADGRCVAFASWASNLVPGDTNGQVDVFVRVWQTGSPTPTATATPTPSPSSPVTLTPAPSPTPTASPSPTRTRTPTATPAPITEVYCASTEDRIYRVEGSAFYGYDTDSASGSTLRRVTSPPAPQGWTLPAFVPDSAWRQASFVWCSFWESAPWLPLPSGCPPIGLLDAHGVPWGEDAITYLIRRTFVLSPPQPGWQVTRTTLQMWSDNKSEWWWQGSSIATDREGDVGEAELFPGRVLPGGGVYTLAIQNSNDRVYTINPHGVAYRLSVTWQAGASLAGMVHLPLVFRP